MSMTHRVPATVTSSTAPMINPVRSPMNTSRTTMTMPSACSTLTMKPRTEASTTLGWS